MDKMFWTKCRGQNVMRTKCYWSKCRGQNVVDKMSWTKRCGQNVLDTMSWTKCSGQNVVVKMSWSKCRGQSVVINMFWSKNVLAKMPRVLSCIKCVDSCNSSLLFVQQQSYLAALVPQYEPTRSLRSSPFLSICIPSRKTAMARSKSFSSVASDTWNGLPSHLSSISALPAFRKRLMHHLFSTAFPGISTPSTGIPLFDVITSTNVNHARCTLPPS